MSDNCKDCIVQSIRALVARDIFEPLYDDAHRSLDGTVKLSSQEIIELARSYGVILHAKGDTDNV